ASVAMTPTSPIPQVQRMAALAFLKCVGKAVLKAAVKALPFGDSVVEIANDAYEEWGKQTDVQIRLREGQALAQAVALADSGSTTSRPRWVAEHAHGLAAQESVAHPFRGHVEAVGVEVADQ